MNPNPSPSAQLEALLEELHDLVDDMKIENSPLTSVDEDLAEVIFDKFPQAVALCKEIPKLKAVLEGIANRNPDITANIGHYCPSEAQEALQDLETTMHSLFPPKR